MERKQRILEETERILLAMQGPLVLAADRGLRSDSAAAPLGSWRSDKGACYIGWEPSSGRLAYEDPLPAGRRLHGWFVREVGNDLLWQGALAMHDTGGPPQDGPSLDEPLEIVGYILVRMLPDVKFPAMEAQIRVVAVDDDWSLPVRFQKMSEEEEVDEHVEHVAQKCPQELT